MARLCPVCGSDDTGGSPIRHKDYTARGRLDIDGWVCHACQSRWHIWHYVREGVEENKEIRLKDGRAWQGDAVHEPAPCCPYCSAPDITLDMNEGHNHRGLVERYSCAACGTIWQWITESSGKRWRRTWRRGEF